jgi:hypothetical protein
MKMMSESGPEHPSQQGGRPGPKQLDDGSVGRLAIRQNGIAKFMFQAAWHANISVRLTGGSARPNQPGAIFPD